MMTLIFTLIIILGILILKANRIDLSLAASFKM